MNFLFYNQFGPKGIELKSVGLLFDTDVAMHPELRPDASTNTLLSFLYDGDGEYVVMSSRVSPESPKCKIEANKKP